MAFPQTRPRRLRKNAAIRRMVCETRLSVEQLIQPQFVIHGRGEKWPIPSMPGIFQVSTDQLVEETKLLQRVGVPAMILFGLPKTKDEKASEAYAADGIIQQAIRAVKDAAPEMVVITDVCLCEYMSHGHCGMIIGSGDSGRAPATRAVLSLSKDEHGSGRNPRQDPTQFTIDNDSSLELLTKTALSHAEAGADMVAPSDMMDGRVKAIRSGLDENGFQETIIMSYAVKYASAFYGPFREAADSRPQFGDRKTYQMDPANAREAIREAKLDEEEGADVILVKPAGSCLDIISKVRESVSLPIAAYQVSGEYAMIKAAAEKGWLDEKAVMIESLTAIRRAGADLIISYFAQDAAKTLSH